MQKFQTKRNTFNSQSLQFIIFKFFVYNDHLQFIYCGGIQNSGVLLEKKNELEKELERTKKRLVAAEKLTYLLADEGIKWKDQIKLIEQVQQQIIGYRRCYLAVSTVSYLGAFTGQYREQLIKDSLMKFFICNS